MRDLFHDWSKIPFPLWLVKSSGGLRIVGKSKKPTAVKADLIMGRGKSKHKQIGFYLKKHNRFVVTVLRDDMTMSWVTRDGVRYVLPPDGKEIGAFDTEEEAVEACRKARGNLQNAAKAAQVRENGTWSVKKRGLCVLRYCADVEDFAAWLKKLEQKPAAGPVDFSDRAVMEGRLRTIIEDMVYHNLMPTVALERTTQGEEPSHGE